MYLLLSLSLYNGPLHPALTASQRSRGKNTEGNKKLINHFVFIDQLLKVDNECTFIWILLPFYVVSGGWVTFVRVSSRHQPHSNWAAQFQDIILLTSEMFNVSEVGPHERWVVQARRMHGLVISDCTQNQTLHSDFWSPQFWHISQKIYFHPWNSNIDMPPPPSLSVDQIPRLRELWSGKRWPGWVEGTLSGQVTLSDLNGWIPEMLPSPEKVKSVQSASINVAVEFLTIKCSAGSMCSGMCNS